MFNLNWSDFHAFLFFFCFMCDNFLVHLEVFILVCHRNSPPIGDYSIIYWTLQHVLLKTAAKYFPRSTFPSFLICYVAQAGLRLTILLLSVLSAGVTEVHMPSLSFSFNYKNSTYLLSERNGDLVFLVSKQIVDKWEAVYRVLGCTDRGLLAAFFLSTFPGLHHSPLLCLESPPVASEVIRSVNWVVWSTLTPPSPPVASEMIRSVNWVVWRTLCLAQGTAPGCGAAAVFLL